MARAIGSVVLGYVVIFVTVFASFSITYLILGTEGAFKSGSYDVSPLWIVLSIFLSLAAAVLGGYVCAAVAKGPTPPRALAAIVLILGLALAIPALNQNDIESAPRPASVGKVEAMQNAKQPTWMALLNPFIGAAGVLLGARRKRGVTQAPIM